MFQFYNQNHNTEYKKRKKTHIELTGFFLDLNKFYSKSNIEIKTELYLFYLNLATHTYVIKLNIYSHNI